MNKDVIYIDVEDDITAIIGKVKDAKQKIVAVVPPKRMGVLQSAVNLRLLGRAADQANKRIVLISNNAALAALAASAQIPTAKNLQSKPELAEISALDIDNGDDVIDGANLPVGDFTKMSGENPAIDDAIRENAAEGLQRAKPPVPGRQPNKPKAKSGVKVPNFGKFRKKFIMIAVAVVVLISGLVWAIFFAPRATVIITARTTDSSVNAVVKLASDATTKLSPNSIKTVIQQTKKDASVEFKATGKKEVGEKSKGQVVFKNCESGAPVSVPSGTALTVNDRSYKTQSSVSVPGGAGGFGGCSSPGESSAVDIVANEVGSAYNTPSSTVFRVAGHSSGSPTVYFNAVASTDITGGSSHEITIVSASDIETATRQLAQQNADELKNQLKSQFNDTFVVLDQSFKASQGSPVSSPALDKEVTDGTKAKLTSSVTYSLSGVAKADADQFLTDYFNDQIKDSNDRRVYDNGLVGVTFTNIVASGNGFTGNIVATAKIGPKIDDNAIKELVKGKRYGDIQSSIESIQGVDNVDVKFWPFFVSSAPDDTKRISIEFNLNDS
jgi:hypothetical protein